MVEGENSSTIYLMYCKNFCKCHNVPPSSATIKNRNFFLRFNVGKINGYKKRRRRHRHPFGY
jgi:hypothetical protein